MNKWRYKPTIQGIFQHISPRLLLFGCVWKWISAPPQTVTILVLGNPLTIPAMEPQSQAVAGRAPGGVQRSQGLVGAAPSGSKLRGSLHKESLGHQSRVSWKPWVDMSIWKGITIPLPNLEKDAQSIHLNHMGTYTIGDWYQLPHILSIDSWYYCKPPISSPLDYFSNKSTILNH